MKSLFLGVLVSLCLSACLSGQTQKAMKTSQENQFPVQKSDQDWKAALTPEQYYVLRQQGTERPFTGKYWNHTEKGAYHCAGCQTLLFQSDTKFSSMCGWPSFFDGLTENIIEREDRSHGMIRVEVLCKSCGGHLGHVFEDGPRPTGLRYCINSAAITFKEAEQ
ncbi:MAG: peptide-methionine (R)-S-oxide reductase MsrB [Bernardetiaceae bacterium]